VKRFVLSLLLLLLSFCCACSFGCLLPAAAVIQYNMLSSLFAVLFRLASGGRFTLSNDRFETIGSCNHLFCFLVSSIWREAPI